MHLRPVMARTPTSSTEDDDELSELEQSIGSKMGVDAHHKLNGRVSKSFVRPMQQLRIG